MLLENKVVIVTGGSRGIGRAIALASAREGADIAINYWRDNDQSYGKASAAESIVGEIESLGRRAIAVEGNVAERETASNSCGARWRRSGVWTCFRATRESVRFMRFSTCPLPSTKRRSP